MDGVDPSGHVACLRVGVVAIWDGEIMAAKFTRKHYVVVAEVLNAPAADGRPLLTVAEKRKMADTFGHAFRIDNPRFDYDRFIAAIGLEGA